MKYVYRVQMQIGHGEKCRAFLLNFETALESVEAIHAELSQRGMVLGNRLETIDDGAGGRMIRHREPFVLGVSGLVTLQNMGRPVWEPE